MAILGDGKSGIYMADSLEQPSMWPADMRRNVQLDMFDVLLTNPPFGREIKVDGKDKLAQYELAHKWSKRRGHWRRTDVLPRAAQPQVVFIERSLQLLRDGGVLGIVLPETFFHAPTTGYIREFIKRHNVMWIADLPHNTFRPHNNAKCIALVLQKNTPQQAHINLAVAEQMGHDHLGKEIYRWDFEEQKITGDVWDDIQAILMELASSASRKYTFSMPAREVFGTDILVPRYYWSAKDDEAMEIAHKEGYDLVTLRQLQQEGIITHFDGHGSPDAAYKGRGPVPYVRVKDIVNWEVYRDPTSSVPQHIYEEKRRQKVLRPCDILYVRRGSYRIGSVAILSPFDTELMLTREIAVIRVLRPTNKYDIDAYYLLYLLSHSITQMQTFNKVLIETTLPNIGNRWLDLGLPIARDPDQRRHIRGRIKEIVDHKWQAFEAVRQLEQYGDLTT